MKEEYTCEGLNERFERLVLQRPETVISPAHRQRIADKFAGKTLQELNEFVSLLDKQNCPFIVQ